MRLFIAIELPEEIKVELIRLRTGIPRARWVPVEQIHLTLAFLGETDEETARKLAAGLARIKADPFRLLPRGIGCFPNLQRPRVVWTGLKPEPNLLRLAAAVHESVLAAGIALDERPFSPHLTVARLTPPCSVELSAFLDKHAGLALKPFDVREFTLFQSLLTRQGAMHIPLRSFPLADPQLGF